MGDIVGGQEFHFSIRALGLGRIVPIIRLKSLRAILGEFEVCAVRIEIGVPVVMKYILVRLVTFCPRQRLKSAVISDFLSPGVVVAVLFRLARPQVERRPKDRFGSGPKVCV